MNKQTKKPVPTPTARKAAKTLGDPKASNKTKSDAGKFLAKHAEKIREIQSAPKVGSITRSAARNAAKIVLGKKK